MAKAKQIRYDPYNDLYIVLGISATATAEEIQRAFRQRAKEVHPDLNPNRVEWATEQFRRLNEAYAILGNPSQRADYDRLRSPHHAQPGSSRAHPYDPDYNADYNSSTTTRRSNTSGPTGSRSNYTSNKAYTNPMGGFEARYAYSNAAARPRSRASRDAWSAKGYVKPRVGEAVLLTRIMHQIFNGPFGRIVAIVLMVLILSFSFYVIVAPIYNVVTLPDPQAAVLLVQQPVSNTLAQLTPTCQDQNMTLSFPQENQIIDDTPFGVRGTAAQTDFSGYTIQVESTDPGSDTTNKAMYWELPRLIRVRHPSDGLLVDRVSLQNIGPGNYIMRLVVYRTDGSPYPPCERRIIHIH